jgi:hypothetical protein
MVPPRGSFDVRIDRPEGPTERRGRTGSDQDTEPPTQMPLDRSRRESHYGACCRALSQPLRNTRANRLDSRHLGTSARRAHALGGSGGDKTRGHHGAGIETRREESEG